MKRHVGLLMILLLGLALVAGCSSAEVDDPKEVVIGSKPMTEQYILGEMLTALIEENTDITVVRQFGIGGGTSNLHPAVLSGEIDMYPEYSGTGWLFVLSQDGFPERDELYRRTKEMYLEEFDIVWFEAYGFDNTFTLALDETVASSLGLQTFSDLAGVSGTMSFGAEFDFFERDDGFDALTETYGMTFDTVRELDIGLKYQAIAADEVDVINAFSTDGMLKEFGLTILEDDLGFFPTYLAGTIIRAETLEQYPELEDVLRMLEGAISTEEMIDLNYRVDVLGEEPIDVALNFLRTNNLLD